MELNYPHIFGFSKDSVDIFNLNLLYFWTSEHNLIKEELLIF